jgi:hypothetical protein
MIIALALAAAGLAAPPLMVTVHAARGISPLMVKGALEEAAAIWRRPGVTLTWRIDDEAAVVEMPGAPRKPARNDDCTLPFGLAVDVVIEDGPPTGENYLAPIGWIVFDENTPRPEIHLSHSNALEILVSAYGRGGVNQMTILQRRTYMSRALGRALAHEVGHYLLGSKQHTTRGLMKARQTASDMFGLDRSRLDVTIAEQSVAIARLAETDRLTWSR